jgi:hypothetical protein
VKLATRLIVEEALEDEAGDAVGRDYYEHGAQPGQRYRNEYRHGAAENGQSGSPSATLVEPAKVQLRRPNHHGELTLGRIVIHGQAAVVEKAGGLGPALEAVVDGLAGVAVFGDHGALLAQPSLHYRDERPAAFAAHSHALRRSEPLISRSMAKGRHAPNRLAGNRRLVGPGQFEELALGVRSTGSFNDRSRLAAYLVEEIEARVGIRLHQPCKDDQMLLARRHDRANRCCGFRIVNLSFSINAHDAELALRRRGPQLGSAECRPLSNHQRMRTRQIYRKRIIEAHHRSWNHKPT